MPDELLRDFYASKRRNVEWRRNVERLATLEIAQLQAVEGLLVAQASWTKQTYSSPELQLQILIWA